MAPSPLWACHGCGADAAVADTYFDHVVCEECCASSIHPDGEEGHVYEYDRGERDYPCCYCGALPPHDWYDRYDDYDLEY